MITPVNTTLEERRFRENENLRMYNEAKTFEYTRILKEKDDMLKRIILEIESNKQIGIWLTGLKIDLEKRR